MIRQEILSRQIVHRGDFCHVSFDQLEGGYPEHTHNYVEITVVTRGKADHVVDGTAGPVVAGDVSVIHGYTRHGFQRTSGDFRICNVMYAPDMVQLPVDRLRTMAGYQALFILGPAQLSERGFRSQLRLNAPQLSEFIRMAQRLAAELRDRQPGFDSLSQAWLLELIVFLSRSYVTTGDPGEVLLLGEAVAHMETNYLQAMTITELAAKANLSKRHFLRVFGKAFGRSPIEHLIQLRVAHARDLLGQTALGVSQVAYASGFNDSNYFSRQFKRLTGHSPRAFRNALKQG